MQVTDYGSLRARAGWAFSNFLPYGFAGIAVGRGSYSVTSLVFGQQSSATPPVIPCDPANPTICVDYSYSNSISKTNTLLYGYSVGGGIDVRSLTTYFLRAEYEYIQFAPFATLRRRSAARGSAPASTSKTSNFRRTSDRAAGDREHAA